MGRGNSAINVHSEPDLAKIDDNFDTDVIPVLGVRNGVSKPPLIEEAQKKAEPPTDQE